MTEDEKRLLREKLRAAKASGDFDGAPKPARKVRTGSVKNEKTEEDVPKKKRVKPVKSVAVPKREELVAVDDSDEPISAGGIDVLGLVKKILLIGGIILVVFIVGIIIASRILKSRGPAEAPEVATTEAAPEATTEEKETHPNYTGFLKKYDWKNKSYAMKITAGDKTGIYEVSQSGDEMAMRLVSGEEELSRFIDKEKVFMSVGGAEKKWYRTAVKDAGESASSSLKDTVIPDSFESWLTVCGVDADVLDAAEWAREDRDNAANTMSGTHGEDEPVVNEKVYDVLVAKSLSEGSEHAYYVNRSSRKVEKIVITGTYVKEDGGSDTFTKEIEVHDVNRIEKSDEMDSAKEIGWDKFVTTYQKGLEKMDSVILSLMEAPVKEEPAAEETTEAEGSSEKKDTTEETNKTEDTSEKKEESSEKEEDSSEKKDETSDKQEKSSETSEEDNSNSETNTAPAVE